MTGQELATIALGVGIGAFGWLIRSAIGSVTKRLDALETTLQEIVKQVVASGVLQDVNKAEIEKLRATVHSLQSDVVAIEAIQSRCRHCTPKP